MFRPCLIYLKSYIEMQVSFRYNPLILKREEDRNSSRFAYLPSVHDGLREKIN